MNIYRTKKEDLIKVAQKLKISTNGTIKELRERISFELYDKNRNKN